MADPILIVAALNGSRDRKVAKKLPFTPAEIAKEAKRAVEAGAGRGARARPARRRRPCVRPHVRRDRDGDPRARRRADLDHDAAHPADIARHHHGALRRPARAARARHRECPAARARAARAPRGGAPDPRGLRTGGSGARAGNQHVRGDRRRGGPVRGRPPGPGALAAPRARRRRRHVRAGPRRHTRAICSGSSTRSTARSASCAGSRTPRARRRRPCARRARRSEVTCASASRIRALLPDGTPATSNGELVELAVALADALGREPMEPAEARRLLRG